MALGPTLTIASGATDSNAIPEKVLEMLEGLTIYGPASQSGTVTVQVSALRPEDNTPSYVTLQSNGADVTVAATKALVLTELGGFGALRLHTTSAPGTNEVYRTTIQPWSEACFD